MYAYRSISSPNTREEVLDRITELQGMFRFEEYAITEESDPTGRRAFGIVAVNEIDEGGYPTIAAALAAYVLAREHRGFKGWNIARVPRP